MKLNKERIYNVNSDNGKVLNHLSSRIWIENRESHSLRLSNVEEEWEDIMNWEEEEEVLFSNAGF